MSGLSILILTVITLAMITIVFSLAFAMVHNFNSGKAIRQELTKNINNLRYGNLLTSFGINKNEFVHKVPLVEIENGMRACMSCKQTEQCDKELKNKTKNNVESMTFCPNTTSVQTQKATYE